MVHVQEIMHWKFKKTYAIVFWCFLKCFSDVGLIKREWHLAYTQKLSSKEEIRLFCKTAIKESG